MIGNTLTKIPHSIIGILLLLGSLGFSFFLMFHTFSYDGAKQEMRIATKAWSDFGAHIPLIRSFSQGPNLTRLLHLQPIESPLFPGEPIRYHFGFYAFVGFLEKLGIRIDWALNIPSAIGFFLLLLMITLLSYHVFGNMWVSILTVLFTLFHGSLSFLRFFKTHPLSASTLSDIVTNTRFPSFGPWDGGNITAFWSLNIYTNQRHLAFAYAILLLILWFLHQSYRSKLYTGILVGLLLSLLIFINFAVAGIAALFLAWLLISTRKHRMTLFLAGLITLPAFGLLHIVSNANALPVWQPGYLIRETITVSSFARFWWENLGLSCILIPAGFFLAPKSARRFLGVPLLFLFLLPNMYRFSTDMINNHKFFNFFVLVGNMFSAYAFVFILKQCNNIPIKQLRKPLQTIVGIGLIGILTISGIIDFFPIINDPKGSVSDIPVNPDVQFILAHTQPTDIVANSTWFYHPASLAGRALFSGYTYFTWSYGYDQTARETLLKAFYASDNRASLCTKLRSHNIALIELVPTPESYLQPNWDLWQSISPSYTNPKTNLMLYTTQDICTGTLRPKI